MCPPSATHFITGTLVCWCTSSFQIEPHRIRVDLKRDARAGCCRENGIHVEVGGVAVGYELAARMADQIDMRVFDRVQNTARDLLARLTQKVQS